MLKKGCEFVLISVIVHHGLGSRVLRYARAEGIYGGAIFFGSGTVKNFWLELFELCHSKKEIVLMVAEKGISNRFLNLLSKELQFEKHNHGIAFTSPVSRYTGAKHGFDVECEEVGGDSNTMYEAIYVIVQKGNAERAVDAAQQAGAHGGTIINARGAGSHETSKVFLMEIEPEKEILLVLSRKEKTKEIIEAVIKELELDEHGNGIIFVQDVNRTYGLYEEK